jgi:E3 ubiquitin-protein ligase CHFR
VVASQHPHNLSTHADLIQSCDIYACFGGNTVEVEIMLEYVENRKLNPRHIYRDIVQHVQQLPGGFQPLIELDLFKDMHAVAASGDTPRDPPNKICRHCAAEIMLWGLKDWWIRERRKGFLEEKVINRPNCPEGTTCERQRDDHGHAREYNHIFSGTEPNNDDGISSGTALPMASDNVSVSSATSSAVSSLSFLLNADNVEVDSRLSILDRPFPSSETRDRADTQSS